MSRYAFATNLKNFIFDDYNNEMHLLTSIYIRRQVITNVFEKISIYD